MAGTAETPAPAPQKTSKPWLWIVAAVVVVAVIAGGLWYWHNHRGKSSNPSSTSSLSAAPAGWARYTNTKYGFTFVYPKTWGTPNFTVSAADKGRSYSINFTNSTLSAAQQAKQPTISVNFDSDDMSRKVCAVNDATNCATSTAFTQSAIKTQLSSAAKSGFAASDSTSFATVGSGPTSSSEALSVQQIVHLTTANASAARLTYLVQTNGSNCAANKFSPNTSTDCISQNTYNTASQFLKSIQQI